MTWFITSYTGAMRSNIAAHDLGLERPRLVRPRLAPAPHERVVDPELVEAARGDEVDEIVDRVRPVVEARRRERITAPASLRVASPRRWIDESGVSRGTRTSCGLLQRHDAARYRFCLAPERACPRSPSRKGRRRSRRAQPSARVGTRIVRAVHRHHRPRSPTKRSSTSSRGERRVAVELGRDHLDPRADAHTPTSAVGCRERPEEALRVRRPRAARHTEKDPHGNEGYAPP